MQRLIAIVVAFLTLTAVSAVTATSSSASVCQPGGTGCTQAGTYSGLNAVINSNYNSDLAVVWTESVVQPYSSGVPLYWTAYVTYTNFSTSTVTLTCPSPGSTPLISENMSGGSGDDGTVYASSSQCTENPGLTITVPPGGTATDWATFHNVPWPGSAVAITWGDIGTSTDAYPFGVADADWAGASFCSQSWPNAPGGVPYMTTYKGVAACGNAENASNTSNSQGTISYQPSGGATVYFDSAGFQCVELAARYFYFQTTLVPDTPTTPPTGATFVSTENQNYPQITISSVTDTFQNSLTPGSIISMWSSSDPSGEGHVGVVTGFQPSGGNVTGITIMDENANGSGTSTITVSAGGTMSFGGYNEFQWTTNLPGS